MNKLILLAATLVFSTGILLAQSSPTASDTGKPNAAPEQTQRGAQATPPLVPHQPPEMNANPERPGATPITRLPSTTVDDQQPGNSSSPASTMGTTGNTPGSDQSTTGNQSGNLPGETTPAPNANPQKPKSDKEPHDHYSSGSSNPNSSATGPAATT